MDRLSALLLRFGFSADTFFQGTFCGSKHFPAQPGRGHLHLVREGPATFVHADGTRLHVDAPTLILYPRPQAHGLHTGAGTAQLLCASVHLAGDGEAAIDSLPACLQVPLAQLPAMAGVLELLFDEAQHGGLGQKLVLNRLCDVLIVQLLRHALARQVCGRRATDDRVELAREAAARHAAQGGQRCHRPVAPGMVAHGRDGVGEGGIGRAEQACGRHQMLGQCMAQ